MSSARSQVRQMLVAVLAISLQWSAPSALAEGGFAQQSEAITIHASGDGFNLSSTTGGVASAGYLASGVGVWNTTTIKTTVPADLSVNSNSVTATALKGGSSISVGQATTMVTVIIDGKTYVVLKEIATALARSSQFGSSAAVEVQGSLSAPGNGYSTTLLATSKSAR